MEVRIIPGFVGIVRRGVFVRHLVCSKAFKIELQRNHIG